MVLLRPDLDPAVLAAGRLRRIEQPGLTVADGLARARAASCWRACGETFAELVAN